MIKIAERELIREVPEPAEQRILTEELLRRIMTLYNELVQIKELKESAEKLKADVVDLVKQTLRVLTTEVEICPELFDLISEDAHRARLNALGHVVVEKVDGSIVSMNLVDCPEDVVLKVVRGAIPAIMEKAKDMRMEYSGHVEALQKIKDIFTQS